VTSPHFGHVGIFVGPYRVHSSFKGFSPLETRWDYSSKFSCKKIHIHLLTFYFLCHLLKCAPSPKWLCHQSITDKTKYETTLFKNDYDHSSCTKKLYNSFKMWLKTFKYTCQDKCFFLVWKFVQMWKINMKGEYLNFFEKKFIRLKIMLKIVTTSPYWFWFGNNFLNV
jgi:hypothetical protein